MGLLVGCSASGRSAVLEAVHEGAHAVCRHPLCLCGIERPRHQWSGSPVAPYRIGAMCSLTQRPSPDMALRAGVRQVLKAFYGVLDPWKIAQWFASPSSALGDRAPANGMALNPDGVLDSARCERHVVDAWPGFADLLPVVYATAQSSRRPLPNVAHPPPRNPMDATAASDDVVDLLEKQILCLLSDQRLLQELEQMVLRAGQAALGLHGIALPIRR